MDEREAFTADEFSRTRAHRSVRRSEHRQHHEASVVHHLGNFHAATQVFAAFALAETEVAVDARAQS